MSGLPEARVRGARWMLALAGLAIGAGGLLLGLQVDGNGELAGSGWTPLALGALVALVVTLAQLGGSGRMPRDLESALGAVTAFLGIAFLVAGVLAPGGAWMFAELVLLVWVLARRHARGAVGGASVRAGELVVLGLMLVLRLWIVWQGSRHAWQLVRVELPILSWLPFALLEPIQSVSLGSFSPREMGFPASGIDFGATVALWASGFVACALGLWLRGNAAREHENDRIHDVIWSVPGPIAALVERLLPEEDWERLGLHGLSERRLARRLEALVAERVQGARLFHRAFEDSGLLALRQGEGTAGALQAALLRYAERVPAEGHHALSREGAGALGPPHARARGLGHEQRHEREREHGESR